MFSESVPQRKGKKKKIKILSSLRIDSSLPLAILSTTVRSRMQSPPLPCLCQKGGGGRGGGGSFQFSLLVLVRLLLCLTEPGEEGGDGFQGHTFACLLCGVLAGFPLVEGLLFNDVLVVQRVKEHPQQICGDKAQRSVPQHNWWF